MMGFALGIASALCWAGLDVVRKALAGKASPTAIAVFLLLGQLPFLGAWALLDQTWITDAWYWLPAVISMAMNALANVLFMRSLQLSPLSRTVPFLSLAPVFAALAGIPLLGELPEASHWAGILLVVAGALVLNSDLSDSWWRALAHEKGAPYMMVVALLWAASIGFDKQALPDASPAAHAFLLTAGSALMLLGWVFVRGNRSELRDVLAAPKALLAALIALAVAALAFQMLALQWLWIAVVETLKRPFELLGSLLLGRVFFAEAITPQKVAALVLMLLGTALLALT
jgi:drug/metabolite transporter (DMT)-like permease